MEDPPALELSRLKEDVLRLKKLLREKDGEMQQLYLETRNSTAATCEDQLLKREGNIHFSMWRKTKLLAGGVFVGLVAFFTLFVTWEVEYVTTKKWEICIEWM